jgi:RNA polymerase sigma factor (sigma-70 family)
LIATPLAAHFFRHEYARLVALLCRRVGTQHLVAVEDAVQGALLAAVESWAKAGPPDNPTAWLFRVAYRGLIDELRQGARRERLNQRHFAHTDEAIEETAAIQLAADVGDDLLRMLFVCCDEVIPLESQLVLALKTLCGFDTKEIAERLCTSEASVYKRLSRARTRLAELGALPDDLAAPHIKARLPAVQSILYLMFTEGYLSSHPDAIRGELCAEAKRLARLLAGHPLGGTPETHALLALMHLHSARMKSRLNGAGELLLLQEQDRSLWDQREIAVGLAWMQKSAAGIALSRYHAEAGIAAEHCLAPSLAATRWDRIVACYDALCAAAPTTVHVLGRALAIAEWQGPEQGLAALDGHAPPIDIGDSYLWPAVLADLHGRCGHATRAAHYGAVALERAPSKALRDLLQRRLDHLGGSAPT